MLSILTCGGGTSEPQEKTAEVIIPDKQLSLAIGKEGQNVRLAVRLTGWRIDIKSQSQAEEERVEYEARRLAREAEEAEEAARIATERAQEATAQEAVIDEEVVELVPEEAKVAVIPEAQPRTKPSLRFAEDVLIPPPAKPEPRKKKKKGSKREQAEDGIRLRRQKRDVMFGDDEDEYF
jgi:N utilization substance protein A